MSASVTIVSFLLIESSRLEPFPKDNTINYRILKIFNRDHFHSDIASQNSDVLDPNDMWREWKIKFLNVVDTHAPLRTK